MSDLPVIRDGFKNFNFNADLFLGKDKKQWTFSIKGFESVSGGDSSSLKKSCYENALVSF